MGEVTLFKGHAVWVRNRVSILAILVVNWVWFLHSSVELGVSFRKSYFFIVIDKTIDKRPFTMFFILHQSEQGCQSIITQV